MRKNPDLSACISVQTLGCKGLSASQCSGSHYNRRHVTLSLYCHPISVINANVCLYFGTSFWCSKQGQKQEEQRWCELESFPQNAPLKTLQLSVFLPAKCCGVLFVISRTDIGISVNENKLLVFSLYRWYFWAFYCAIVASVAFLFVYDIVVSTSRQTGV